MSINNSYLKLALLILCNIFGGLHMILSPESINRWLIVGIGVLWVMEGVCYIFDLIEKHRQD